MYRIVKKNKAAEKMLCSMRDRMWFNSSRFLV